MIFTIKNIIIQILLLFTTITTPNIIIKNSELKIISRFMPLFLWVTLYTVTFFWYFNENIFFKNNNSFYLVLISIIIPFIMYFYNSFFQTRLIILCLLLIFDVFNHNKNIFNISYDSPIYK